MEANVKPKTFLLSDFRIISFNVDLIVADFKRPFQLQRRLLILLYCLMKKKKMINRFMNPSLTFVFFVLWNNSLNFLFVPM